MVSNILTASLGVGLGSNGGRPIFWAFRLSRTLRCVSLVGRTVMYAPKAKKMVHHCVHLYSVYVAAKPPMIGPRPER